MSLFVDASALVALAYGESDADALLDRLSADTDRLTSPIAVWETYRALAKAGAADDVRGETERLIRTLDIRTVAIGGEEAQEAIRAHARYGKGSGHPAQLNMGDCFAYACARTHDARLLYKGGDFVHTDLA